MSNVVALPLAMYELKTPSSIDILFPKMSLNHNGVNYILKKDFVVIRSWLELLNF